MRLLSTFGLLLVVACGEGEKESEETILEGQNEGECSDGIDNDDNGDIDCDDAGCVDSSDCLGDTAEPEDPMDIDDDGDGVSENEGDCDDADDTVSPNMSDDVGDGVDQNCDGVDGVDEDGDGEPSVVSGGTDCDDTKSYVGTQENESCDELDRDCNPETTDGVMFFIEEGKAY